MIPSLSDKGRDHILILPFHGIGHFNGLFGVARALQKTHEVVFAGAAYFHKHVYSAGFPYRILSSYPFGLGLEQWIHEVRKTNGALLSNIYDRWTDKMYNLRNAELAKVLAEIKPVHVILDAQQATDAIVLRTIDPSLKISIVHVAPPYLLIPGLPPANSRAMPDDPKAIARAHRKSKGAIVGKAWRQKLKYLGMDDRTLIARRLRRNKLSDMKSPFTSLITFAVKGLDQYVLTYREFDFDHPELKDLRYVGPQGHAEQRSSEFIIPDRKRIIYCSFGTVPSKRNIANFLSRLHDAVEGLDALVIVSAPGLKETFKPKPDRMVIHKWVPQTAILTRADVFITHGGINSVHDAIRSSVPMLVYPLEDNYDQNGNSSRVVYRGFGLRGDFDKDTASEMRSKLNGIFGDIRFRKNLEEFKKQTSDYTLDRFVKMILS